MKTNHHSHRNGSAFVAAIICITVLALIAGQTLRMVTSRLQTAHRSGAWNEALVAAEAGVDLTIADITGLLPDVRLSAQEGIALGTPTIPPNILSSLSINANGVNLSQGITLSYQATTLTHGGEGSGQATTTMSIDVLPLSSVLNGAFGSNALDLGNLLSTLTNPTSLLANGPDLRLIQLRSRGTVPLSGPRRADPEKLDNQLRRPSLVWDSTTQARATRPTVSREVEVLLRPVLPFQNAIATTGNFSASAPGAVFDSFNSLTPLTSTNGRYDAAKRLQNGDLSIGGAASALGGNVHGDVRVGGSAIPSGATITGTSETNHSERLPVLRTPTWSPTTFLPTDITGTSDVTAGSLGLPARVKVGNISGTLRVNRGLLNLGTHVEIWITGDVTGGIEIASGIHAKIYVQGQVRMNANRLVNGSNRAANMQIYGIGDDPASGPRGFEINGTNLAAAIYMPTHHVILNGSGDFSGAIAGASFTATDAIKVHFDEALALNVGPVLRYAIASYIERPQ